MEEYSTEVFEAIQAKADNVKSAHSGRDGNAERYYQMYQLQNAEMKQLAGHADHVKVALHPSPANKVNGLVDLMASTEAIVSVPKELNAQMEESTRNSLESMGQAMWYNSGTVAGKPLEESAIVSLAIFDEVHIVVRKVKDLLLKAQKDASSATGEDKARLQAEAKRLKRILSKTPYLFDIINAQVGYPIWDNYGLQSYLIVQNLTHADIIARYGEEARKQLEDKFNDMNLYGTSTVWEWWDLVYHTAWLEESDTPLMFAEHDLDVIPVACALGRGTRLFAKPEAQRRGFFHTMEKTGLWTYQSFILSVWMTKMSATLGLQYQFEPTVENPPEFPEKLDSIFHLTENPFFGYSVTPEGWKMLPVGERGVIDPASREIMGLLEQLTDESTLFDQALGRPIGGRTAYSTEALYHQAGQLPIETIKRQLEMAIGEAITIAFLWMRKDKGQYKSLYKSRVDLDAGEIPEDLVCKASLKVDLPQQKLQMLNAAKIAVDSGLAPLDWIVENLLGTDGKDWLRQILVDQGTKAIWGKMLENKLKEMDPAFQLQMQQQMQALQQQQMQQMMMAQGAAPGGQKIPGQSSPGGTPANPDQRLVEEPQGGLPPELAVMGGGGPQVPSGDGYAPQGEA